MSPSPRMTDLIQKQIQAEFFASSTYMAVSIWFDLQNYKGKEEK